MKYAKLSVPIDTFGENQKKQQQIISQTSCLRNRI